MINITKYLNQGLTRKTRTSYDKYGKSNTTNSNFDGRLVASTVQNRGLQAKPLDYDVEVWMEPDQAMLIDDIIFDGTVNYRVIQVNEYRTKSGDIHHKKALCQKYV